MSFFSVIFFEDDIPFVNKTKLFPGNLADIFVSFHIFLERLAFFYEGADPVDLLPLRDGAGKAGDDFTLSGFTGPRFNLGLGGNMFSRGETYPGLKAHDAQWGFGVAGTYSDAIQLRLGYDFGLTKSIKGVKGADVSPKVFRNVLTFGIAFLF